MEVMKAAEVVEAKATVEVVEVGGLSSEEIRQW